MPLDRARRALSLLLVGLSALPGWACGGIEPGGGLSGEESDPVMTHDELAEAISGHLEAVGFPATHVEVEPWDESEAKIAVYFTSAVFSTLYPEQRYHWLRQALPEDFVEEHLSESVWFELAPGETTADVHVDQERIAKIAPEMMQELEQLGFFAALDDVMAPEDPTLEREPCGGDFRIGKRILAAMGFERQGRVDRMADAFHVLISKGAYCDCEILTNVYAESRLGSGLWSEINAAVDP